MRALHDGLQFPPRNDSIRLSMAGLNRVSDDAYCSCIAMPMTPSCHQISRPSMRREGHDWEEMKLWNQGEAI